jgi:hypothetical protein
VAELGSVFLADDGGPRGPDLRVTVEVPREALGASFVAPVPERIASAGELIERVRLDGDEPGFVTVTLPETLPEGAVLRLRGQGGRDAAGERPGDLWLVIELVDRPPRANERIIRSTLARQQAGPLAPREGTEMTWWILGGLALLCGGVLAALFLL